MYPPLTYIQKAGCEYPAVTPDGIVNMIPVRVNVSQPITCEKIMSQNKVRL